MFQQPGQGGRLRLLVVIWALSCVIHVDGHEYGYGVGKGDPGKPTKKPRLAVVRAAFGFRVIFQINLRNTRNLVKMVARGPMCGPVQ